MIITKDNIDEFLHFNNRILNITDNTNITAIEYLPESLEVLYCYNTKITELPTLPDSLWALYCYNTRLIKLPKLPKSLEFLYCRGTNLPEWQQLYLSSKRSVSTRNWSG